METSTFALASGRVVGVTEFGDRNSEHVVVFAHPAPGSSRFDPDPDATGSRSVRIIALDRPGYGESQLVDGGPISVARAAEDIVEYLDSKGIASFAAAGWSAGGRVALALAAAHPERVARVALIGTPAPDADVAWVGDDNRATLEAMRGLPLADAVTQLDAQFRALFGEHPTGAGSVRQLATPDVDDALLATANDRIVGMLDRAVEQGYVGSVADIISYTLMDLGFDLDDVSAKALLLYGQKDPIGSRHAEWYRGALSDARVETVPGRGHLLAIPMWGRVLSHLAPGTKG